MKGFDTLKVKSAVKTRNKFDLSRTHLTTMEFGQILPLFCDETVPGDKFNVNGQFFARLAPLVKPTYGRLDFRTVAAFVPYHQIAVDAEAWLAGKTTMEGQTPKHRYITMDIFHGFLISYCFSTTGTAANSVYTYVDNVGNTQYCVYKQNGKYIVKILNALGYSLPQNVDVQTTSSWYSNVRNVKLSAYPILAFFKLYNDYMSQSQRFNTSQLSDVLFKIKNGITDNSIWSASTGQIGVVGLGRMFDNLLLNYDNDYFTSAWQKPNNALSSVESVNSVTSVFNSGGSTVSILSNAENQYYQAPGGDVISQRALDFLKSFDDWVRRNNYSGSRAVQQIYSRFGIKPDDFRAHYAHVITTANMPIQIGDVTAQAGFTDSNSNDIPLGDYAGKGILSGQKGFGVSVDDFGMLFVLGYFTIVPMNAFGFDRRVLRNTPLDYYNPEFDGLGADPISLGEVFTNPTSQDATFDTDVYGFTERYNSYRYGRDLITGEFRDQNVNSGDMNVWHTGRDLTSLRSQNMVVAQSSAMNTLSPKDSEYNRIFSNASGDEDHFYLTARFNVDAIRPMLNLNQVPNLGEGDTIVPRNGNVIS